MCGTRAAGGHGGAMGRSELIEVDSVRSTALLVTVACGILVLSVAHGDT